MFFRFVISAAMIASASSVSADTVTLQIADGQFNEVVRDSAQINGIVVAGALRHGALPDAKLSVSIDPAWRNEFICARVITADGLYEAENVYMVPASWDGGTANLDFPTQHAELLSSLEEGALAVRITRGSCVEKDPNAALAIWRGADGEDANLLINAFAADEVFMYVQDKAVQCTPLPISGLAAFDHSCKLPDTLSGAVDLQIFRVKDGKAPDPADIRLFVGQP